MITDEMVEAAAKAIADMWVSDAPNGAFVNGAARAALLAALAAVPVGEEVESVIRELRYVTALSGMDESRLNDAASLLRSLAAERNYYQRGCAEYEKAMKVAASDVARLTAERDRAIRQRDQAVEALTKIEATPAWGSPGVAVQQIARSTLAAIRQTRGASMAPFERRSRPILIATAIGLAVWVVIATVVWIGG